MNVNYFSSIVSSQTFNTNIYDASRNQRSFGGNVDRPGERILVQRHARPQRVPHPGRDLEHDRLDADGKLAAGERHAQRDAVARLASSTIHWAGNTSYLLRSNTYRRRRRPIRA